MYSKKYWLLFPPFFLVGMLLLFVLPRGKWPFVFLLPLIFWAVYYWWEKFDQKTK